MQINRQIQHGKIGCGIHFVVVGFCVLMAGRPDDEMSEVPPEQITGRNVT